MGHDDLAFVRSVVRLLAADGRRGAGIDSKFKVQDGVFDSCAVEAVPMRFDDVNDGGAGLGGNVEADDEVLGEFGEVSFSVPDMDVSADVGKGLRWMAEGLAELLEFENTVVEVVAVVHWDIPVDWFRAPDFGWDVDGEGAGERRKRIVTRVRQNSRQIRRGSSSRHIVVMVSGSSWCQRRHAEWSSGSGSGVVVDWGTGSGKKIRHVEWGVVVGAAVSGQRRHVIVVVIVIVRRNVPREQRRHAVTHSEE